MDLLQTIVSSDGSSDAEEEGREIIEDADQALGAEPATDDLAYIASSIGAEEWCGPAAADVCSALIAESMSWPTTVTTTSIDIDAIDDGEAADVSSEESSEEEGDSNMSEGGFDPDASMYDLLTEEEDQVVAAGATTLPRTKNEVLLNDIDIGVDVPNLSAGDELALIGELHAHISEEMNIVVRSYSTKNPLAEDTVLCSCLLSDPPRAPRGVGLPERDRRATYTVTDDATETDCMVSIHNVVVLGPVLEIFGPLQSPYYLVRYRGVPELPESAATSPHDASRGSDISRLLPGASVYSLKRTTKLLQEEVLAGLHVKGSDASNVFDEEVSAGEVDYSDDEAEREAKAKLKATKRGGKKKIGNTLAPATTSASLGPARDRGTGRVHEYHQFAQPHTPQHVAYPFGCQPQYTNQFVPSDIAWRAPLPPTPPPRPQYMPQQPCLYHPPQFPNTGTPFIAAPSAYAQYQAHPFVLQQLAAGTVFRPPPSQNQNQSKR